MKLEEREMACLKAIGELPIDDYVLIGGYAASSFDFPRFSVDLDIVIRAAKEKSFLGILEKQGFKPIASKAEHLQDLYGGRFKRLEKEQVKASVDLLINSVISRQTKTSYAFAYVFRHSELREVSGFSSSLKVKARVANREMLIALKTNSMRLADKRDIVALCNGEIYVETVANHLKRCPQSIILKNIDSFLETLDDQRYKDSLKGVFRLSDSAYVRIMERARQAMIHVKGSLND
ncbi:hypothetical protein HYR54_15280 [Candidatus Acetothermia bacterium]|nr:hypothetical protein [Candidatus Acetothermia bacterium]